MIQAVYSLCLDEYGIIGPVKASALYGLILTKLAISYCLKQNPTTPNNEWNVMNVHSEPINTHLVKYP